MERCYHCGDDCQDASLVYQEKVFCCHGCKMVFEILADNDLTYYYDLQTTPGSSPGDIEGRFEFLDNQDIKNQLLEFDEQGTQMVSFMIPKIHCSSCIWVLENLNKLEPSIKNAQVNFPQKSVRITYHSQDFSLKELTILLCKIGYEPKISLDDLHKPHQTVDRSLIYKLGVAGFAFGNIMFLSFPEYFDLASARAGVNEFWLDQFKGLFRWLMFSFSLPVVCYSARDYLISAYKGLVSKMLNIDVPIALGILVLFIRSSIDIVMDWGSGFFDSLSGLVFFLLLGKFFQQKTYAYLSFERDYKSYFPIAVTRLMQSKIEDAQLENNSINQFEVQTPVYELKIGDHIIVRNSDLIPTDGLLVSGTALIDYSFVTGEAEPVTKHAGEKIFAGGRQTSGVIEIEVLKGVEQSYLTQLWNNEIFSKTNKSRFKNLTDQISQRFTITILSVAIIATIGWIYVDAAHAFTIFTAVLIVACPCAIALAAPFTLGNMLRIFGRQKLYLKESNVIEQMAHINTVVFDKTGTLTTLNKSLITYEGFSLTDQEKKVLTSTLRASSHPLSRALYDLLRSNGIYTLDNFEEESGRGMTGSYGDIKVKVGSYSFVGSSDKTDQPKQTQVHISTNETYKGCYVFYNNYREGMVDLFTELNNMVELVVLSGDNDGEHQYLKAQLPPSTHLIFNQKPNDKLDYIKNLQKNGKRVMMVGDGLNDAGALAQSDVGIAVSEDVNVFSPACDGILDAGQLKNMSYFLKLSQSSLSIIKYAFVFSLVYNLIGLGFAVSGHLEPVVAAILMPLSSISIVVFTSIFTNFIAHKSEVKIFKSRT